MKRRVILLLSVSLIVVTVKAQFDDTMILNQWLNQMNMDLYQQQQKMGEQLMNVINQEVERQKNNASATCLILPDGFSDTFFAYVSMCYLSPNELEIVRRKPNGIDEVLSPSSYVASMGVIITPSMFTPGMTITVRKKETRKAYSKISIPMKESQEYESFVIKARRSADILNNINTSNNSSRRSYDQIQFDMDKAYERLGDMRRNKRNLKDNSVLHSSYDRMIQKEEQCIEELKKERDYIR